jgi:hypothetical protein
VARLDSGLGTRYLAVAGDYAVVGGANGLHVAHLEPEGPRLVAHLDLGGRALSAGRLWGDWLVAGGEGLAFVDLASPCAPVLRGLAGGPGSPLLGLTEVHDMDLAGDRLALAGRERGLVLVELEAVAGAPRWTPDPAACLPTATAAPSRTPGPAPTRTPLALATGQPGASATPAAVGSVTPSRPGAPLWLPWAGREE